MRKCLYSLLIFMGYSSMMLIADDDSDPSRIYLSPDNVMISKNGIIVNLGGVAGITDILSHDINGLYTHEDRILWIDSNGHFVNGQGACPRCGEEQRGWKEREQERENQRKEKEERERKAKEEKERGRNNKR